jgi:hypothetical protein
MARAEHLAFAERYLAAFEARDLAALAALRLPTCERRWPQSGERALGREAIAAVEQATPEWPEVLHPVTVTSLGPDSMVIEVPVAAAGAGVAWEVVRLSLVDGQVGVETLYHADPFEAPAWRSAWVERRDPLAEVPDGSEPAPGDGIDREDAERWGRLLVAADLAVVEPMHARDWEGGYPQSGERYPSVAALVEAHEHYPGGLPVERLVEVAGPEDQWVLGPLLPLRIHGSGACWMFETRNDYADGSRVFQVVITRLQGGRMHRTRWYWCDAQTAAGWRSAWVEGYEPLVAREG